MSNYDIIDAGEGRTVRAWKRGVPFDDNTIEQLKMAARLPFVRPYVAAMPDAHLGTGSTIGTVMPTVGAICPAAVGVDIGCGMYAQKLAVTRYSLEREGLADLRRSIEKAVPHGRTNGGARGDRGAWFNIPEFVQQMWDDGFADEYKTITDADPGAEAKNTVSHLGTLGTGNHFIELAEDEDGHVWLVLHSGSRGLGNKIGSYFTKLAQTACDDAGVELPHRDLAYLLTSSSEFARYKKAVQFAQRFAWMNRIMMKNQILKSIAVDPIEEPVHCHHNYISWETHEGRDLMITRKGAVKAGLGDLGIIPGSMGAKTYIVRGLGNPDSFCSCSHGAGRKMSRTAAEKFFTVEQHQAATAGVECDKTAGTLDETPGCYKDIDAVMAAQSDLVEPVHVLKQFLNVKGIGDKRR